MPAISYLLENYNFNFSLGVYLSALRTSAFRFYQKFSGQDVTKLVGGTGCLRGIARLLSAAQPHQHVGDCHRAFPIALAGSGSSWQCQIDFP